MASHLHSLQKDSAVLQAGNGGGSARPAVPAVVVMGVSGCGKSSVADAVAATLGWTLCEGDSYHSPESVAKMRAGLPLTDADRASWLDRLASLLAEPSREPGRVLTCSALRRRYRDHLRAAAPGLAFVFLQLDYPQALERVQSRPGHFFSPSLVQDQFATLESPVGEGRVLTLDATAPIGTLARQIADWLRASPPGLAAAEAPSAVHSTAHG